MGHICSVSYDTRPSLNYLMNFKHFILLRMLYYWDELLCFLRQFWALATCRQHVLGTTQALSIRNEFPRLDFDVRDVFSPNSSRTSRPYVTQNLSIHITSSLNFKFPLSSVGTPPSSCSLGHGFISQPRNWRSWPDYSWFSPVPPTWPLTIPPASFPLHLLLLLEAV